MNYTCNSVRTQQQFVQAQRPKFNCLNTFNLLTSDLLFDEVERLMPEHRERLFPPTETLAMFVTQALSADRSCQQIVNQAAVQRLVNGLPGCSTHTGGYCRARNRLPLNMVMGLSCYLGRAIDRQTPESWRWHGRKVKLVDGTTVTMADTPANQAAFPQQCQQKPGLGFPICRILGITCLSSGALLDAAVCRFNGKGGDERALLRSLQETLDSGDILIGDALFPTYFFIASMQEKGVDILMEQQGPRRRSTDFRRGKKLGQRDHLIVIKKPRGKPDWMSDKAYQQAPESITVREFKAGGKIMVTTMTNPKDACKKELQMLYRQRWSVELDIRDIKETMGMDTLSCKSPDMALKEIWVHFLAYNLIRLLMMQSALKAGILAREISFKHCLQLWLIWQQAADPYDENKFHVLCLLIAQQRVGNRPGRIEPRAVKRRPKTYLSLMVPRHQAREDVRVNGHPKKVK